jgi:hypothetical protein
MVPIAQVIGNGTGTNMNFLNIPQTFKDLMLVINATSNSAHSGNVIFNYTSFGTYSGTYIQGDGSSAISARITSAGAGPLLRSITYGTTIPVTSIIHFMDYTNTSRFKSYIGRNAGDLNGSGQTQLYSALWQKTEAITEILLSSGSGSIYWTGTATLYGIKAGA